MRVQIPKGGGVSSGLPATPVAQLQGHEAPVQAVCFSADGQYCWTAGVDRTVRLWNPSRLDPAFPPKPKTHSIGHRDDDDDDDDDNDDIAVHDLPRALSLQVYTLTHPVADIAVQDEALICCCCGGATNSTPVVTWIDVVSGTQRKWRGHTARVNAVAVWAPQVALSASYDATVRVWDMRSRSTAPIQVLAEAKDSVTDVHVVSMDGSSSFGGSSGRSNSTALIRTASVDGTVRTYDLRMGVVQCDDMGSPITSMAVVPTAASTNNYNNNNNNRKNDLAVSCLDGTIRVYDSETATLKSALSGQHQAGQYSLPCQATANGDIVSGSEDGRVVIYDAVRGNARQCLLGHSKPTSAIATHPTDSSVVVTSSFDHQAAVVWADSPDYMRW